VNEELVATDTLATYNEEFVATAFAAYNEELTTADTLATDNGELAAITTLAAHDKDFVATDDEEFDATTTLAVTKTHVNVELAEKYLIVKNDKTEQNAKSQLAINTGVNILKNIENNCAKSRKIVEVSSVEAEIVEFDVEQTKAGITVLTSPQNTKNDVEVNVTKWIQIEKVAKTILNTNTVALRTEITNKFKKQIR
jgi:hypothetical protein